MLSLSFVKNVEMTLVKKDVGGSLDFQMKDIEEGGIEGRVGIEQSTYYFSIFTTATNEVEINAAIVELYQQYQAINDRLS